MTASIKSVVNGDTTTLSIKGDFRFDLYSEFRAALESLDPKTRLVLDLGEVSSMDSSAMGMLLNMKQTLGSADREIRLIRVPDNILKLLLMARFDRKFEIL
ncbi:MAG: STAS domain-containing protein [Gammaproteobacteria bacterium SHHR-1]|uniref:STAS domain-containing protein n=1 Tax=Magnetovirga frankeli TaxID=947516 RepID=UPI00129341E2|nr:STAS domain-containing protein [gamma proteobacterium SS-5]